MRPPRPPARSLSFLLIGGLALLTLRAQAEEAAAPCSPDALAWARACGRFEAVQCYPERVIVQAGTEPPLRVDIARHATKAFRTVGAVGLSPIGEFADWNEAPLATREAFDALVSCAARDATFLDDAALPPPAPQPTSAPPAAPQDDRSPAPWGLVALVVAGALAAFAVRRALRPRAAAGAVATPSRWQASPAWTLALLGTVVGLEAWALHAADPDFFLPDPFHVIAIGAIAVFTLGAFVRAEQVRRGILTLAIALPLVILLMEWRLAAADVESSRVAVSDDLLLRYTYRPGLSLRDRGGESITVTPDGLWDVPHEVPRPADVVRVVVLGDSVPNDPSIPFRQRFPKQLEALLAKQAPAGRRVEVVNVSCEGYNTLQEVRLLEKVGLRYQPDLIVLTYVLNDPFLQNGGYRRLGNSFFAFRLAAAVPRASACPQFAELHQGYSFDLVVRASLERLRLVAEKQHVPVLVTTLPLVQPFDDRSCLSTYDQVLGVAREQGFATGRLVDAFAGEDYHRYLKPEDPRDLTHPNADGHQRIAKRLAELAAPLLWPAEPR